METLSAAEAVASPTVSVSVAAAPAGVRESGIVGLKSFDQLLPLLKRLHEAGCDCDKAGNRKLHFDQYAARVLLYLFNPICSSLRAV